MPALLESFTRARVASGKPCAPLQRVDRRSRFPVVQRGAWRDVGSERLKRQVGGRTFVPSSSSSTVPSPALAALAQTAAAREPVRYTGELQPDPNYYDGRLPHAVGVHHIQAFRSTRTRSAEWPGFTYNHQPFLVWWRGRFFLHFLSAPVHEHDAPTCTFLTVSADGYAWSPPQTLFPEYRLPAFQLDGIAFPAGMSAVMHQRMGFHVAPNGRLLALGFYGICPDPEHSPNAGNGVGRVVREIHEDGTFGPIFVIRYNRHAGFDERNTTFPFYATSADAEFRAACDALLADKLVTLQWWEEDRGQDGFFAIDPSAVPNAAKFDARMVTSAGAGKAFTWFTRPDGVVVGLWKNQYSALSPDRGRTWTPIVRNRTLRTTGAKTWGQRTSDGRYAIVYNHSATATNRFPISALVGEDGQEFPTLLCLGGEVPPRRYYGKHKNVGLQYFRGISEGSEPPPGGDLWVAYSSNKEDIWVLRAAVPLTAPAPAPAREEIARAQRLADLRHWNLHLPKWASARLVADQATGTRALELRDEDPWDYAQAERVFPGGPRIRIQFRIQGRELPVDGSVEIELQTQRHDRPVRLRITRRGLSCEGATPSPSPLPFELARWHRLSLDCDCESGRYTVSVDGQASADTIPFAEPAFALERIIFRTGAWRGLVPASPNQKSAAANDGDLPHADVRDPATVCWVTDLTTESQ